jgi:hypothetical protein
MRPIPLRFRPGVYRNGTEYDARGRWRDADCVRWIEGTMRPIGGWSPLQAITAGLPSAATALDGIPRGAVSWRTRTDIPWLAVGTTEKLYAYSRGEMFDITPSGLVAGRENAGATSGIGSYGYGPYGFGLYGTGSSAVEELAPDTWSLDVFGNFLVGTLTSDGRLLSWESDSGVAATAVSGAPIDNVGVVVTPERFVFCLGANGNKKQIAWAERETLTAWTATPSNDAGDFELQTNGVLVCGKRSRTQTLLWTNTDLHAATFVGGEFVYSFTQLGENCGIIGPNAAVVESGVAYWMGTRAFYGYDGFVKPIPCEVSDFVFGHLNYAQRAKVYAVGEPEFGEVWWFYPSTASNENDRYVVYNYRENHWAIGSLSRTAGVSRGVFSRPLWMSADGMVYEHESGLSRTITEYADSGPIELGQGERTYLVNQIIPDERTLGDTQLRLYGRLYPTEVESSTPLLTVRQPTDCRLVARQVRLRIVGQTGVDWRVGEYRLDVVPRGKR